MDQVRYPSSGRRAVRGPLPPFPPEVNSDEDRRLLIRLFKCCTAGPLSPTDSTSRLQSTSLREVIDLPGTAQAQRKEKAPRRNSAQVPQWHCLLSSVLPAQEQFDEGKKCDGRDDALRNDAIKTPYLQHVAFDVSQIQCKSKSCQRCCKRPSPKSHDCEEHQNRIASNSDRCNRYSCNLGKGAMIYDSTIPVLVNAARLRFIGIVNTQCERRDDDPRNGQNCN